MGVNSAIFSVSDAILPRPLPYPQPDRLVSFWEHNPRTPDDRGGGIGVDDADSQPQIESVLAIPRRQQDAVVVNLGLVAEYGDPKLRRMPEDLLQAGNSGRAVAGHDEPLHRISHRDKDLGSKVIPDGNPKD